MANGRGASARQSVRLYRVSAGSAPIFLPVTGSAPRIVFARKDGEPGLNYLCKGYYQFFAHVAPYMDFMKNELLAQRPPANIMAHLSAM